MNVLRVLAALAMLSVLQSSIAVSAREPIAKVVTYPSQLSETFDSPTMSELQFRPRPLSRQKSGIVQRLSLTGTWIDGGGANDVGLTDVEIYGTFGFPLPTPSSPLLVTPGYQCYFFNGPTSTDLPARVHDAYLGVRWLHQCSDSWGMDLAVSPGVHTDFDRWDSDAFRITGHAVGKYEWTPWLDLIVGAAYLDRQDISVLPVMGLVYRSSDCVRHELIFPRPKFSWRLARRPSWEDWFYVAGEFGGGSWSVTRTNFAQDVLTIREIRLNLGLERQRDGGGYTRIELGWVLGRRVEFKSGIGEFEPKDSVLIRSGWSY